jgi:hypothetical protein
VSWRRCCKRYSSRRWLAVELGIDATAVAHLICHSGRVADHRHNHDTTEPCTRWATSMPRACCLHPNFPRRAGPKCSHFVLGNSICELIGLLNLKYWCYFLMTTPAMDSVTASHTGLLTSCTHLQEFRSHRLGLRRLRPGQRRQLHSNLQPHHARPRLLHKRRPGTLPQQGPGALGRCPHDQRHLPAALRR